MKKNRILTSLLTSLTFCLTSTAALADPITNNAEFTCPNINIVSNFGSYLAGFGVEVMLSQNNPIYFKSTQYPSGVPDSLANYSNSATSYDSVRALVTCSFTSNNASESPFDISYYVTNGQGGIVTSQANNTINVAFPVGYF